MINVMLNYMGKGGGWDRNMHRCVTTVIITAVEILQGVINGMLCIKTTARGVVGFCLKQYKFMQPDSTLMC